jgi:diadenosine tetraphosphate (Ap4A) HIT family hydrolase
MHPDALVQLGGLMASAQKALKEILTPEHLYISRYGHAAGHAFHFHIIPVCGWVRQRFLGDPRYRILRNLTPPSASDGTGDKTDGRDSRSISGASFVKIRRRRRFPARRFTTSLKGQSIHVCAGRHPFTGR